MKNKSFTLRDLVIALIALVIGLSIGYAARQPEHLSCERPQGYFKDDYKVCKES